MPSKRSERVSNIDSERTDGAARARSGRRVSSSRAATNSSGSNATRSSARLADADQLHRDAELGLDGEHDAALGGAVELGEHDAGDVDRLGELAGLREAVLAGGRVEHEQHLLERAGRAVDDAAELLSSSMRLTLVCSRPGGVDEHEVGAAARRPRSSRRTRPSRDRRLPGPARARRRRARPSARAARRRRRGTCRRRRARRVWPSSTSRCGELGDGRGLARRRSRPRTSRRSARRGVERAARGRRRRRAASTSSVVQQRRAARRSRRPSRSAGPRLHVVEDPLGRRACRRRRAAAPPRARPRSRRRCVPRPRERAGERGRGSCRAGRAAGGRLDLARPRLGVDDLGFDRRRSTSAARPPVARLGGAAASGGACGARRAPRADAAAADGPSPSRDQHDREEEDRRMTTMRGGHRAPIYGSAAGGSAFGAVGDRRSDGRPIPASSSAALIRARSSRATATARAVGLHRRGGSRTWSGADLTRCPSTSGSASDHRARSRGRRQTASAALRITSVAALDVGRRSATGDVEHRTRPLLRLVADAQDLAVRDVPHDALDVAQARRAQAHALDGAGLATPVSMTSPTPYWSSMSMKMPGEEVRHDACAPKPSATPMIARAGDERREVRCRARRGSMSTAIAQIDDATTMLRSDRADRLGPLRPRRTLRDRRRVEQRQPVCADRRDPLRRSARCRCFARPGG